jgi:hypothetical protein
MRWVIFFTCTRLRVALGLVTYSVANFYKVLLGHTMNRYLCRVAAFCAVLVVAATIVSTAAVAQINPQQILAGVIQQLQTGSPNPSWYGGQLWMTIASQTNNSGQYPALAQLGPVQNINVVNQVQMPTGPVYSMVAQHANGTSTWTLGISTYTNKIEYANFNINAAQPPLPPQPPTTTPIITGPPPTPGATPNPPAGPPPTASPSSPACQKFPNLC